MHELSKKTFLHNWHTAQHANMASFGGYDMPLWYGSAKNEHLAVLTSAGLFDTSHMAVVAVKGSDSFELLQYCFTNDLTACVGSRKKPLSPGRCVYGAFLTEQGTVVDDTIIFELEKNNYLAVVNAGMGGRVAQHLTVCKVSSPEQSVVLDSDETAIGSVLTCVTDMGIGWYRDKIYSITSPGQPTDFIPHGLCCGFVKVNKKLEIGQTLFLQDNRRTIRVRVVKDIRPDRTARRPINEMI